METQNSISQKIKIVVKKLQHDMEVISLWQCWGIKEAQVALMIIGSQWGLGQASSLANKA